MVSVAIVTDPALSDRAKVAYTVLTTMVSDNGVSTAPISALMAAMGCSRNTMKRALTDLADAGYIEITERKASKASNYTNSYRLIEGGGEMSTGGQVEGAGVSTSGQAGVQKRTPGQSGELIQVSTSGPVKPLSEKASSYLVLEQSQTESHEPSAHECGSQDSNQEQRGSTPLHKAMALVAEDPPPEPDWEPTVVDDKPRFTFGGKAFNGRHLDPEPVDKEPESWEKQAAERAARPLLTQEELQAMRDRVKANSIRPYPYDDDDMSLEARRFRTNHPKYANGKWY